MGSTSDRKTRTSVSLGNDWFPKRTTYQTTYNMEGQAPPPHKAMAYEFPAEVLPLTVYPPPTEPLRRTIYREDFGSISTNQTLACFEDHIHKMEVISRIHAKPGVPLAPHDDVKTSKTDPSEQQTGYKNKVEIAKEWASIQKFADNDEVREIMQEASAPKVQKYEKLNRTSTSVQ